ncbi:MAG: hypothetical protein ACI9V1_001700 [Spirosomataceae bacterium]|jgi:hypothetical protein
MTIQEINAALHKTMEPYLEALGTYTDEQFAHKEADDIWSLGQLYEHLVVAANFFFLANTVRCLDKRKGQEGGEMNANGDNVYSYNSFPPIKVKVPGSADKSAQPEAKEKGDYVGSFNKMLADIDALTDRIVEDEGTYKTHHAVFDWLNAKQWCQMLEMHHRHHHRQKAELEGFAGVGAAT